MTDKVQKIKEYLVGMAGAVCCDDKTKKVIKANILPFIDSLQEEPVVQCVPFEPVGVPVDKVVPANIPDKKEEPVSEELIDAAEQYVEEHIIGIDKVTFSIATDMFVSGAQWQRQKDEKDPLFSKVREDKPTNIVDFVTRLTTVEQEFLWEHIEKVKKLDREDMKERMMKNAVNATVSGLLSGLHIIIKCDNDKFNLGDKVKLIIIKEE